MSAGSAPRVDGLASAKAEAAARRLDLALRTTSVSTDLVAPFADRFDRRRIGERLHDARNELNRERVARRLAEMRLAAALRESEALRAAAGSGS